MSDTLTPPDTFTLADALALADLATYLGRAARVEDGSVRVIATGGVLAVYSAVLYPKGLLDESPTVLGLRTFALNRGEEFDAVVPIASLTTRLERLEAVQADGAPSGVGQARSEPITVTLPMRVNTVTWAAISPPRGGWIPAGGIFASALDMVARAGIEEIAHAVPSGVGEQIVHKVRSQVWGREIPALEHVPAGAGFAALSLGFLQEGVEETVTVFETGPWTRLTTKRGHVLVKRKAWSIAR
jgi:hypothetical protein